MCSGLSGRHGCKFTLDSPTDETGNGREELAPGPGSWECVTASFEDMISSSLELLQERLNDYLSYS